jgi:hypothetical protein
VTEAVLLVVPLGARIEVVDAKAHPEQTAGAQRVVDDQRGDLGSLLWRAMSLADAAISFIFLYIILYLGIKQSTEIFPGDTEPCDQGPPGRIGI